MKLEGPYISNFNKLTGSHGFFLQLVDWEPIYPPRLFFFPAQPTCLQPGRVSYRSSGKRVSLRRTFSGKKPAKKLSAVFSQLALQLPSHGRSSSTHKIWDLCNHALESWRIRLAGQSDVIQKCCKRIWKPTLNRVVNQTVLSRLLIMNCVSS